MNNYKNDVVNTLANRPKMKEQQHWDHGYSISTVKL